jgi:hypothetical protein
VSLENRVQLEVVVVHLHANPSFVLQFHKERLEFSNGVFGSVVFFPKRPLSSITCAICMCWNVLLV